MATSKKRQNDIAAIAMTRHLANLQKIAELSLDELASQLNVEKSTVVEMEKIREGKILDRIHYLALYSLFQTLALEKIVEEEKPQLRIVLELLFGDEENYKNNEAKINMKITLFANNLKNLYSEAEIQEWVKSEIVPLLSETNTQHLKTELISLDKTTENRIAPIMAASGIAIAGVGTALAPAAVSLGVLGGVALGPAAVLAATGLGALTAAIHFGKKK